MKERPRAGAPLANLLSVSTLRWVLPLGLLGSQFLLLSVLVDLPTSGAVLPLVGAVRVGIPVVIGAIAAGWLVARASGARALRAPAPAAALPGWRPIPALAAQLAAFVATAYLALRLLGPGAPSIGPGAMLALLACAGLTALLALLVAVPAGWLVREVLRRWRAPLLAVTLGVAAWRAATLAERLWGALSSFTLHAAGALLQMVASGVAVDPGEALIGIRGFEVLVAPECSGADGLGLMVTFQLVWIALARERLRVGRALLLVPIGAAVALLANVVRISGLVLLGAAGHEDLALGGFHSKVGWLLFLGLALGTVAVAERWPWLQLPRGREPGPESGAGLPDVASLAPLVAALAVALVTGVWVTGVLDRGYALRCIAAALTLVAVRRALPDLVPTRSAVPVALGLAVGVGWVLAVHADPTPLAGELAGLGEGERLLWILCRAAGSILVIPLAEELAFRGFLLDWLAGPVQAGSGRGKCRWFAVLVSAFAFGTIHASFAAGVLAGLAFGAARSWRGRVGDAVVAHAVANTVVAAATILLLRWDLWT